MPHSIRCHVTIYDCGGQPSDYTSHPAFSSPTAGYVVVCDARHPNPAPYLRFVATHAPTAPVLVVVAHIDETAGADQSVPHMCDDDTCDDDNNREQADSNEDPKPTNYKLKNSIFDKIRMKNKNWAQ